MQQLLNTAKCFRMSYRIIPKTPRIRSFSEKCKKGGDKEKPKEPTDLKCKAKKEEKKEATISGSPKCGGGKEAPPPKCPPKSDHDSHDQANLWKNITLMGAFPLVALIAVFVFTSHKEEERPEFKAWPHMYKRSKPFYFGDGNRSAFHNPHLNPLPPDGYEDEVDSGAEGKPAESDEERAQRLKEFGVVQKEWSKLAAKRESEAKKAEAAAEKEAKRLQAEEEKEEKKRKAEEEKEEKKRKAEEEKERKRIEALEKKQVAAEAKERKRLEALEAKRLKEEAKKKPQEVTFVTENEPDDLPPE